LSYRFLTFIVAQPESNAITQRSCQVNYFREYTLDAGLALAKLVPKACQELFLPVGGYKACKNFILFGLFFDKKNACVLMQGVRECLNKSREA